MLSSDVAEKLSQTGFFGSTSRHCDEDGDKDFLLGIDRKQDWSEEEAELLLKAKESSANLAGSSRVSPGPQSSRSQADVASPSYWIQSAHWIQFAYWIRRV